MWRDRVDLERLDETAADLSAWPDTLEEQERWAREQVAPVSSVRVLPATTKEER